MKTKTLVILSLLLTGCGTVYKVDSKGVCTLNGKVATPPIYLTKRPTETICVGAKFARLMSWNPFAPGTAFMWLNGR